MPDISRAVQAAFADNERAELASHLVRLGVETQSDPIKLAGAWAAHVAKIDSDRALPWTDHSVWTEHDLVAALFIRNFLAKAIATLRPSLGSRMADIVAATDQHYRDITVSDTGIRTAKVASVDIDDLDPETRWWWFRVPSPGPIAEDLAEYSES